MPEDNPGQPRPDDPEIEPSGPSRDYYAGGFSPASIDLSNRAARRAAHKSFQDLHPDLPLPDFLRIRPNGRPRRTDVDPTKRLELDELAEQYHWRKQRDALKTAQLGLEQPESGTPPLGEPGPPPPRPGPHDDWELRTLEDDPYAGLYLDYDRLDPGEELDGLGPYKESEPAWLMSEPSYNTSPDEQPQTSVDNTDSPPGPQRSIDDPRTQAALAQARQRQADREATSSRDTNDNSR